MGTVTAIASGKGGTGKTTTCACLSVALCRMGKKVLAVDCDFGLRNLDLALGLYDEVSFDLADVINGVCEPERAILTHPKYQGLSFLAAPQDESKARFSPQAAATLIRDLAPDYDFVLIDCPASVGFAFQCGIEAAGHAILVTTTQAYALRDAQKVADIITENGITDARLIVNMVRPRQITRGYSKNVDDIIDSVALPLLGVVPYDEGVGAYQNVQRDVMDDEKSYAKRAFTNIARRLCGERVPILRARVRRFR